MSKAPPKAKPLPKLGDSFILPDRSVGVVSGVSWLHPERDVIRRMVSVEIVPVSVPVKSKVITPVKPSVGVSSGAISSNLSAEAVRFKSKELIYVDKLAMIERLVKMPLFIPLQRYPTGVVTMPNEIGAIGGARYIRGKPQVLTQKRLTLLNSAQQKMGGA